MYWASHVETIRGEQIPIITLIYTFLLLLATHRFAATTGRLSDIFRPTTTTSSRVDLLERRRQRRSRIRQVNGPAPR